MRRGFTLTELLVTLMVVCTLSAISYPVFYKVQKTSIRGVCIEHLREYGMAIAMYREDFHGAEQGNVASMGLPPDLSYLDISHPLPCRGDHISGNVPGYNITWPSPDDESPSGARAQRMWASYTEKYGAAAVLLYDPNHQDSLPRSYLWQTWVVPGLRADGSTFVRTRIGYPTSLGWWHD